MAIIDYYNAAVAVDREGRLIRNAEAKVYALSDTTFSSPLTVTDLQGVPMPQIQANADGIYPAFRVASGEVQVVVKSGPALTPMTSLAVYASAAEAAASTASQSASAATTARSDAVSAAQVATSAASVLQALVDATGTPVVDDPDDPGTFLILNPVALAEDASDPGTFLIGGPQ